MKIHVIGAGGIGSWLVPQLVKLRHKPIVWDGDTLEEKNLDRQLFSTAQIGVNKAEALSQIYECEPVARWFYADADGPTIESQDYILCCADNHRARRESLMKADRTGCSVIITGNGYTDADAYLYRPEWIDKPADPRVRYPSIKTDNTDDPITRDGCTGHAQVATPQLVLANVRAADHGLHLFWFHTMELKGFPDMKVGLYPIENGSSMFMQWTKTYDQITQEWEATNDTGSPR